MKLSQPKKLNWLYITLAFLLPTVCFCLLMLIRGFIPFGETSMLYSDMYHQYYPFFVAFRKALLSGDSLLYNWNVGMGMDYLGLIAYYLASPLNLLSVLVPENLTLAYFSLLVPIKLGLAGGFFAIFLKQIFRRNDLSIAIFGCFYALCAWALGYHWNLMWLDTFALLPLVVLGTVLLLRDKKFILYTITLFLSVVSNYYIGLFTCIFVAIVFICYEICRWRSFGRFFADLGRIALFSLLAIGMTAFLELPAFAALQSTQSSVNKFPTGFRLNIADSNTWAGLFDAMRQVAGNMNGGLVPNYKDYDALPNLYCGVFSTFLAFIFLTCKQIKLRDKLCCVALLLFLNLSVIIRQLDYMWHGFHFTNMIPYRFSFLYSFVVLYMAYRAFCLRNSLKLWQVLVGFALSAGIVFCTDPPRDIPFWIYNGVFLLLYLALLLYPQLYIRPRKDVPHRRKYFVAKARTERRHLTGVILVGIMCVEIVLNLVNFGVDFSGTTVADYPRGKNYSKVMLQYMDEQETDLFYRTETARTQTLNDGALNGYNGITTFTSSADVRMTRFMQALGYGAKDTYNRYSYEDGSPVANLFLSLKYMLDRQGQVIDNPYFNEVHHYGSVYLLENNMYLPLGFLADSQLLSVDFETAYTELTATRGEWNKLAFQNELFRSASGVEEDIWSFPVGDNLTITADDAALLSSTPAGNCEYVCNVGQNGFVTYRYVVDQAGYMCLDLYSELKNSGYGAKNAFTIWKNDELLYSDNYSLSQILAVANVVPGDIVELQITCYGGDRGELNVHAGILDDAVFRRGYQTLSQSTLQLTEFTNTRIEGTINCSKSGVLYTSIPQNDNWFAVVDGAPAETIAIGNAVVGLLLPEGTHTITFSYRNRAFNIGILISVASFTVFGVLILTVYLQRRRRKRTAGL